MKKLIAADSALDDFFGVKPEPLEEYVDLPFDLNNKSVQGKIAQWAAEEFISYLNSEREIERKGLEFWPDDIRWSPTKISFEIMEGMGNHIGTFTGELNFYDGDSENYDDVEYLLYSEMKDWAYYIHEDLKDWSY